MLGGYLDAAGDTKGSPGFSTSDDQHGLLSWVHSPDEDSGIWFAADKDSWDFWSYVMLADRAKQAAASLRELGISAGSRVSLVQSSGPNFVAWMFGTMLAGAAVNPLAPPMAFQNDAPYERHLRSSLTAFDPTVVVADSQVIGRIGDLLEDQPSELIAASSIAGSSSSGVFSDRGFDRAEPLLVQFTSGSSGQARGVSVSASALNANLRAITEWLEMKPEDGVASWLPIYHDMGLVGCLMVPIANQCDLWLMQPAQFVRSPVRYVRCFDSEKTMHTAMPNFGLDYIVQRVRSRQLDGLNLSAWRTLILGAERIRPQSLDRFVELLGPFGFSRTSFAPAYGLAEATLAVTGLRSAAEPSTLTVDSDTLSVGERAQAARDPRSGQRIAGCGTPLMGVAVEVVDIDGVPLSDGGVGEIVVTGASVADGYVGSSSSETRTSIVDGRLHTGDIGFMLAGELYVIGRLGDSIKVHARHVFAEDLEHALVERGIPSRHVAVLLGTAGSTPTAVVVLERADPDWHRIVKETVTPRAPGTNLVVTEVARGGIQRTTSGKPRRRVMWRAYLDGSLPPLASELTTAVP